MRAPDDRGNLEFETGPARGKLSYLSVFSLFLSISLSLSLSLSLAARGGGGAYVS